jgi:hypothetical protein
MSYRMVYRRIVVVVTEMLTISIEPLYPKETLNADSTEAQQSPPGELRPAADTAAGSTESAAEPPLADRALDACPPAAGGVRRG